MNIIGDIGGTNARLAIIDTGGGIKDVMVYKCDQFPNFESALKEYLKGKAAPNHALFAAAGPVKNKKISMTNRNWVLDEATLKGTFGFKSLRLVNDFSAMARSVPELTAKDYAVIHDGTALRDAPILVAGPGTGFGCGYLIPQESSWRVLTTEGGLQSFSPRSEEEIELLRILKKDRDYISAELVCSGTGHDILHKAVCQLLGKPYQALSADRLTALLQDKDPVIMTMCRIRANIIMTTIGNMALSGGARGGIFLAGSISTISESFLRQPEALNRLHIRGNRSDYLKEIPVKLITNPLAALFGAAALI